MPNTELWSDLPEDLDIQDSEQHRNLIDNEDEFIGIEFVWVTSNNEQEPRLHADPNCHYLPENKFRKAISVFPPAWRTWCSNCKPSLAA